MFKVADRMTRMAPSGIRKVNEKALAMERRGEKVIHFEVGRPDFDTPAYIKQAAIESLNSGDVFYTSSFGKKELREAIAEKLRRENHLDYFAEEILVTAGLAEAVFDVLATILDEGDEVLVPDPVWINYVNIPRMLNAIPVSYSLKEERAFQPDLEEISSKINEKTRAIVIVSPNNPTGGILSEDTLKAIARLAVENDLAVISDEVYERILYDGAEHISMASLPGMKERTFTLNGMSKTYSMTGWRLGYVAALQEYIAVLNVLHQQNTTCAVSFGQTAAITALRCEQDEVRQMVKEYQRRRDYAVNAINAINGLSCVSPKGAFYLFINCKKLGHNSADLTDYLLEHAKIALVPGDVFGPGGEGYMRMSFANSFENIVEGCRRMKEAVEALDLQIID
jgi:aspartate aminotransferase/aminotransferase